MEGKENQPQNTIQPNAGAGNSSNIVEFINSLNAQDQKNVYDASKFENEEEIKKISNFELTKSKIIKEEKLKSLKKKSVE